MNHPAASKINYAQLLIAGCGIAIALGYVPQAAEEHMITIITIGIPALTMVFRTWFTGNG